MNMEKRIFQAKNNVVEKAEKPETVLPSEAQNKEVVPNGTNSVEMMGEVKFNRLQELGAAMATGKDLSDAERQEYDSLNKEFISAVKKNISQRKSESKNSSENPGITSLDKEKIERLKTLNRNKAILGFLDEDEEKERLGLISWRKKMALIYLNEKANTVTNQVEFEEPVEVFNETDVVKWKNGAENFKNFLQKINIKKSSEYDFDSVLFNPISIREIEALFLGERAATLFNQVDLSNPDNLMVFDLLRFFGFEMVGNYMYDKNQVKKVIQKHEDVFSVFRTKDPDEIMKLIVGENKQSVKNHLVTGLLLGFPIESVQEFEKRTREESWGRIPLEGKKSVNVYGITWADFNDSLESKIKQARLKAAFELSGILNANI